MKNIQLHVIIKTTFYIYEMFICRENFLNVDIFYRQMSYEEIHQQKAYEMFSLWCKWISILKKSIYMYYADTGN